MERRKMSIKEIEILLKKDVSNSFLKELKCDPRRGVQFLLNQFEKKKKKECKEQERLHKMLFFELSKREEGYTIIAGIDEAGRGPLAGPVVAAAVIFSPGQEKIWGLDDSKKLTSQQREILYNKIYKNALAIGIGLAGVQEIDKINIHNATFLAMCRALSSINLRPNFLLVDGFSIPNCNIPQEAIKKGDSKSLSIAAASVIAKVVRDDIMKKLHLLYPEYNFSQNKGYPTEQHRKALKLYGPSPIHRQSFKLLRQQFNP